MGLRRHGWRPLGMLALPLLAIAALCAGLPAPASALHAPGSEDLPAAGGGPYQGRVTVTHSSSYQAEGPGTLVTRSEKASGTFTTQGRDDIPFYEGSASIEAKITGLTFEMTEVFEDTEAPFGCTWTRTWTLVDYEHAARISVSIDATPPGNHYITVSGPVATLLETWDYSSGPGCPADSSQTVGTCVLCHPTHSAGGPWSSGMKNLEGDVFLPDKIHINSQGGSRMQWSLSLVNNDEDRDFVISSRDNCPLAYNPDQSDRDEDTMGDACDERPDEYSLDSDGDGVYDKTDNCYLVFNPGQSDRDGDGKGDPCDLDDMDGDGVLNDRDNCVSVANSDQADADGDGKGDVCDDPPPPCVSRATSAEYLGFITGHTEPELGYGVDVVWCFDGEHVRIRSINDPVAEDDFGELSFGGAAWRTIRKVLVFDLEWKDAPARKSIALLPGNVREVTVTSGRFEVCPELSLPGLGRLFGKIGKYLPLSKLKKLLRKRGKPLVWKALKQPLERLAKTVRSEEYRKRIRQGYTRAEAKRAADKAEKRVRAYVKLLVDELFDVDVCSTVWKPKIVLRFSPSGRVFHEETGSFGRWSRAISVSPR